MVESIVAGAEAERRAEVAYKRGVRDGVSLALWCGSVGAILFIGAAAAIHAAAKYLL